MIILTGGAGFIGSIILWQLNREGLRDVLVVDSLNSSEKWRNLVGRNFADYRHKSEFIELLRRKQLPGKIEAIIHMGACSSTSERNAEYLMENNYRYTRELAEFAVERDIRFIYASSGQVYGDGALGYSDDDDLTPKLRPISMYGYSKQLFDRWILESKLEDKVVGLRFFNVYGPHEYHKGEMRSVIHKAAHQISGRGYVELFRSHRADFADGEQKRDFVSVHDCAAVVSWFLKNRSANGIVNIGTGEPRTWNALAHSVFAAMSRKPDIRYIDIPEHLREQYQYYTAADVSKLRAIGYATPFQPLEVGVKDYVANQLIGPSLYLS